MNNSLNIQWVSTTPENQWEAMDCTTANGCEDTLELTSSRFQTIDGFGGCFNELGWIALNKLAEDKKASVIDELFNQEDGCRFNFCRMPVGANDYSAQWYSFNETDDDYEMKNFSIERDQSYLIPYIKEALKRNPQMKLFASPWSPPTWMKYPKAYNFGTMRWEEKVLTAYALYFLKFVKAYEAEGITVHQIHIQNEPMSSQKFPSCIWKGQEFREFIRDYIGPLFEKEKMPTEIWLGTLNGPETDNRFLITDYDDYANLVLSDPDARKYVKGVSYQWAGKHAVQRTYESWPEVKLMQSENECGDGKNTWEYAHYVYRLFRHYLSNGVNSYIYWNMVLQPGGMSTWGWHQNAMITVNPETKEVSYNPEFFVIKHFSHFIAPGAVRLGIKGHWTGNSVVFENPNGELVIVVANSMKSSRKFSFKGCGKDFACELKPFSINTIVLK